MDKQKLANAIRILSVDAVQKANSGHPGMPMGMADIAEVLWNDFLNHDSSKPDWINRDRFIISNGHGSMLLYSLLHFSGYDISIEDIKNFRQLNSKTPGHPEYDIKSGIETTTGPLGQGLANAVGMSIASNLLANTFNRPKFKIINNTIYCFVGDGCLMEGISHEVCSLAGTLSLKNLIVFWDNNGISIDGEVNNWCKDNVELRFKSYNWHVISIDGHNTEEISKAISEAKKQNKPTLIACKTTIAFGSPNFSGKSKAHGAPLGDSEISLVRQELDWNYPPFHIPGFVYDGYKTKDLYKEWLDTFQDYKTEHPDLAEEFERRQKKDLTCFSDNFKEFFEQIKIEKNDMATRKASQKILEECLNLPELIGGSADLSCSNLTSTKHSKSITQEMNGNYIDYGVREFGMCAIMNGIALFGGFIPYGGTFLTFSDYARNAIRLSALMKQKVIYVLTHDSIGLGEDGPTHQPIEHLASLRDMPGIKSWRPCDLLECYVAWKEALLENGPTNLILSRQNLPQIIRNDKQIENIEKGGYFIYEETTNPELIIIATGSEVHVAIEVAKILNERTNVISIPCLEIFLLQEKKYIDSLLIKNVKKVVIEAGATSSWYRFADLVIGIDKFGTSAPAKDVFNYYGFGSNDIAKKIQTFLNN